MELDQLRTFLAVLEQGRFTRAAQALHVGQSTVSFHLKALESTVGARLVDRRRGGVRPTAAGRLLRRYAERIVALRDGAVRALKAEEAGATGRVLIAASTVPGEVLLPPSLARFRKAHPGVAVRVTISDSRQALAALLADACDLALVGSRPTDRRLVATAFADDEIVLVGPPTAPRRLTPLELREQPLVVREEGSGTRDAVARLLAGGEPRLPPVEVGSAEAAKRGVLAGLGLAFLSRVMVKDDLDAGRLHVIAVPGTPVERRFFAARLREATPAPAVRALLRQLVQDYR